jgi:hypothetical protein
MNPIMGNEWSPPCGLKLGRTCCRFPNRPFETLFILVYWGEVHFFLFNFNMENGREFGKVVSVDFETKQPKLRIQKASSP